MKSLVCVFAVSFLFLCAEKSNAVSHPKTTVKKHHRTAQPKLPDFTQLPYIPQPSENGNYFSEMHPEWPARPAKMYVNFNNTLFRAEAVMAFLMPDGTIGYAEWYNEEKNGPMLRSYFYDPKAKNFIFEKERKISQAKVKIPEDKKSGRPL